LRWFRAENCCVFHVLNAWEEEGRIFADVIQYDAPPLFPRADGGNAGPELPGRLVRWTLDPAAGTDAFKCSELDDLSGEFPRLDERWAGLRNRFGTFTGYSDWAGVMMDTIAWLDLKSGRRSDFTLPAGDATSEPVFVPRNEKAAEGDGWLLAVAWRGQERRSDLIILDTDHIEHGPVATVQLSHRIPFGFHGNWVGVAV
jgi:carotenoid cleavage dioxygenase-like enzyme